MRVWLDDERDPSSDVIKSLFGAKGDEVWCKTAPQAMVLLNTCKVEHISLDHDLGDFINGTGLDVARFIEYGAFTGKLPKLSWRIHSQNVVGFAAMERTLKNADCFFNRVSCAPINKK